MARARLNADAKHDLNKDNGVVLLSMTEAEKHLLEVNLNSTQFNDITGMVITAKVIEGSDSDGVVPTQIDTDAIAYTIPVIMPENSVSGDTEDTDLATNEFKLYLDAPTILGNFTVQPRLNKPVYGFLSVVIDDNNRDISANYEQHFELIRSRLEFVKSII